MSSGLSVVCFVHSQVVIFFLTHLSTFLLQAILSIVSIPLLGFVIVSLIISILVFIFTNLSIAGVNKNFKELAFGSFSVFSMP